MRTERRFDGRLESVPAARRFVRDALSDQSTELVEAVELMACELATNCIQHARTDFELMIHTQDELRVEVRDTNHHPPTLQFPTPEQPSGRGLRIVEAMADSWGVIPSSSGKTVWFTLPLQPRVAGNARGNPRR